MSNVFKVNAQAIRIPVVAVDPATPEDGYIWYNSADNQFKQRANGTTEILGSGSASTGDFSDDAFSIFDDVDNTKVLVFEASTISTATTRTITARDGNVDLQHIYDLITLSGVAEGSEDLGTFTGSTIPDASTIKAALQALETEVELKANDADVIKKDGSVDFTAEQSMGGFKLTNLADPTGDQDAATKAYVDALAEGLKPKEAVRVATTAALDLSTDLENGDIIDGITLVTGDRVLVKNQAAPAENGIYIAQATGAAVRATDFDSLTPIDEINGAYVAVQAGSENAGKIYVQQGTVATLDTDAINFVFFNSNTSLVGGDMITKSGNTLSVDLASDAGLESSNPGNDAGQLRVKLDGATLTRASAGLKVSDAGITETQLATSVAGNGLSGGAGTALSVNVDDSTIEIVTDSLQVKDAGITNAKIATGIDATKIADGSVDNTEFQYLGGVTSDIQTQLNAKLEAVQDDTAPALGGNLTLGANTLIHDTDGMRIGSSATDFYEHEYVHSVTLTASQTDAVASAFSFAFASYEGLMIEYKIKEATTNRLRIGTLLVVSNGTNTSITDTFSETADVGVTWGLIANSGGDTQLTYSTTANDKTMRALVKRIKS